MICCSDLHLKNKEPFLKSTKQFLNWLNDNYCNEELILLGDIFDNSTPVWSVYKIFKEFLLKRKNITHILEGNHDLSKNKGSALSAFQLIDNVFVYEDATSVIIDNMNCLMLPFKYDYKTYQDLEGNFDFIFTHLMPQETQFADEGVSFPNLKGCFFHGHHHLQSSFIDNYNNQHHIVGIPVSTRHLEDQNHKIFKINNKQIEIIKVPIYFQYETINYGEEPSNKNNILNIINVPNKKLVYEKYKDYYIREAGIKLLRTENTESSFKQEFEKATILEKFKKYSIEKILSKEVSEECSSRLLSII